MQPKDQMSTFWLYGIPRMTSGALYDLDWTYELRWSVVKQEDPKSMTFTSHLHCSQPRSACGRQPIKQQVPEQHISLAAAWR